jgi:hypothetical protein
MKWAGIFVVAGFILMVLWYSGFIEEFLGPWAAWANFIGYFQ